MPFDCADFVSRVNVIRKHKETKLSPTGGEADLVCAVVKHKSKKIGPEGRKYLNRSTAVVSVLGDHWTAS